MTGAEEKSFEQLMEDADNAPEPGTIGDPDLGVTGDAEPRPESEDDDEPTQVNDDDDEDEE